MRKVFFIIPVVICLITAFSVFDQPLAADGKALFEKMNCGACHKPAQKTAGSSLATIGQRYQSADKLVSYFKGQAEPVIQKTTPPTMKKPLQQLQALSNEEQRAVADYILSVK
jgi:cytochrome c